MSWLRKVTIVYPGSPTRYFLSVESLLLDTAFWSLIATLLVVMVYRRNVLKARLQRKNKKADKGNLLDPRQKSPNINIQHIQRIENSKNIRHTRYPVVNRRVRTLETLGYIKRLGTKETKASFKAPLYQLTPKAYLAIILNQTSLEDFIKRADEAEILTVLGILSKVL